MVEIDEQKIKNTKDRILQKLPDLIQCSKFIREAKHRTSLTTNEQVAKDQLILPMLRLLGYQTEYDPKSDHLDIIAEAAMHKKENKKKKNKNNNNDENTASRVDYAIFIHDDPKTDREGYPVPRVILEAKSFEAFEGGGSNDKNLQSQVGHYYSENSGVIYLAIASNGEQWSFYGRGKSDTSDFALIKIKTFKLGELNMPENLDCFVHLASKSVIEAHARADATVNEYEGYKKNIIDTLKLRQKIDEVFKFDIDTFEKHYKNKKMIKAQILDPLEMKPPSKKGSPKWYDEMIEKVSKIFYQLRTAIPESRGDVIPTDELPPAYKDITEGENIVFTVIEQQIANKICSMLRSANIPNEELWLDTQTSSHELVKHLNTNERYISYLVAIPEANLTPVPNKWHNLSKQYRWAVRFGNRSNNVNVPINAENELPGIGAFAFQIDSADEFETIKNLISPSMKDKLCTKTCTIGMGLQALRCWLSIDSIDELDGLKEAIVYCYKKQLKKLLDERDSGTC